MRNTTIAELNVFLEKVKPDQEQIKTLYHLLKSRQHNISNQAETSFSDHSKFVSEHPYRAWFLILVNDQYIGSVYISNDNTIGINIPDDFIREYLLAIIGQVESMFRPLVGVRSVRASHFSINVPPSNSEMIKTLEQAGYLPKQFTYSLS